ncbi:MAG: arginyl-tRNA synthetase [Candidatus Berkelbacteria bacterium Athens1014_28]|uniref:Arginine--tRNA ligase n=1 Tax=Candidatus Berkelbacteria bacterium Athens1014_28 TaxID=2017145 RepID=A0A554LQT7_9BACT|nr:MAG: arginyl-tRNA synthetase [Candidatus Berkelbacteria bacterium Athens1014_28]
MSINIREKLVEAVKKSGFEIPAEFDLLQPENEKFGDFSTNVAMLISAKENKSAKEIAEKIVKNISAKEIEKVEVAGTGFINFYLSKKHYLSGLSEILSAGVDFGKSNIGKDKKAIVEFISANPTGPLHIGNARGGPIGDVIANVLSWQGFQVEKEFYVNDSGNQINHFGETLLWWYLKKKEGNLPFPENGYSGDFCKNSSEEIQKEQKTEIIKLSDGKLTEFFVRFGLEKTIRKIKEDIELLGINFDRFVYESDFLSSGKSLEIVESLKKGDHTAQREGALWFIADELDPNDRESVLLRSDNDKTPTYFANDIAYHKDKFDRGADLLVDIWGANHHGHITRMKSALSALGFNAEKLKILLYQTVRLKTAGKVSQMGKRLGNFVNISDLILKMKVPVDVFKFMIISQNPNSILDFDLELAKEKSEKNPVYYLQYAYARICSVLRKADINLVSELEKIAEGKGRVEVSEVENLAEKSEINLIKALLEFPEVINKIASDFQIQSLPHFATLVAREFHNFYANCEILTSDKKLMRSRLLLILATRNVLKITLTLMGISAPEKM